jgi:hypothetical protein
MSTPEGYIKNSILSYLKWKGIFAFPVDSVGIFDPKRKVFRKRNSVHAMKGVSDILGILPGGRFLAIECKSKTGRMTVEQEVFLQDVRAKGGVAFMARSIEDVERHLAEPLKE